MRFKITANTALFALKYVKNSLNLIGILIILFIFAPEIRNISDNNLLKFKIMSKKVFVSLNDLQIYVNQFDFRASVENLVFIGFSYLEEFDFYKVFMFDVRRDKRYVVGFLDGRFVGVTDLS